MSASISLEPQDRSSRIFLCRFPVTVAQSFSGGVAICYVLPVLWTTSRLAVVGRMAMRGKRRCDTGTESDVCECLTNFCVTCFSIKLFTVYNQV